MKFPTGGKCLGKARERPALFNGGQQIQCDSEADGESPDERGMWAPRSRTPERRTLFAAPKGLPANQLLGAARRYAVWPAVLCNNVHSYDPDATFAVWQLVINLERTRESSH